jgi:hypothetical protein
MLSNLSRKLLDVLPRILVISSAVLLGNAVQAALVGHWPADGSPIDIAGGNNGSLMGPVAFTSGVRGQAFAFSGNSYVEIPGIGRYQFGTGDFSVAFWVRTNVPVTNAHGMVSKDTYGLVGNYSGWLFNICDGCGGWGFEVREIPAVDSHARIENLLVGKWYLMAGVRQGTTLSLYVNGSLAKSIDTGIVANASTNAPMRIGALSAGAPQYLNGAIDDVRLYNHALTAAEVNLIFLGTAPVNTAPTANAGAAQSIHAGTTVNLNGTSSFDDNTPSTQLIYLWTLGAKPAGSIATLANAQTATPSFLADKPGTYIAQLKVTDQGGLSSSANVTVSSLNQAPTADAGIDKLVATFQTVQLAGQGADPDGDALTYSWFISARPPGSVAVLNGPTSATPNFQPDVPGTYTLSFTVSDPYGQGLPDSIDVVAVTPAVYVEQNVAVASTVNSQLTPTQVTTAGNQGALGNLLNAAVKAIQKGDKVTAIEKLNAAISRTDGCERAGVPDGAGDGRDWITDCSAQAEMLKFLRASLSALN